MPIASGLFESATFWTILIGAMATLIGAALGAWLTNKYSNPKREIHFAWIQNVSLLDTSTGSGSAPLSVSHGTTVLAKPRIIDVTLHNAGKQAITASSFHAGRPIEIDLDATIIDVLNVKTSPSTSIMPSWVISGNVLEVPPCLLTGGQIVDFSILADGDSGNPIVRSPLTDITPVEVKERPSLGSFEERFLKLDVMRDRITQLTLLVTSGGLFFVLAFGFMALRDYQDGSLERRDRLERACDANPSPKVAAALDCPKAP
ncbi:hypothetical protein ACTMUQ_28985 [Streptomyces sp. SD11]|uniref:hypothetical protein n=1 Tax=Streptomyces sp. SD11 TaxID=3452209 RepID=UPI003F88A839